jgi:hypothetical protein
MSILASELARTSEQSASAQWALARLKVASSCDLQGWCGQLSKCWGARGAEATPTHMEECIRGGDMRR